MYYLIINKKTQEYYINKSKNPQKSIEAHIRRANNTNSKGYNTPLYIALRNNFDDFIFYSLKYIPEWIEKYKQYIT